MRRDFVVVSVHFDGPLVSDIKRVIGPYDSEGEAMIDAEKFTESAMPDYDQLTEVVEADDALSGHKGYALVDAEADEALCGYFVKQLVKGESSR